MSQKRHDRRRSNDQPPEGFHRQEVYEPGVALKPRRWPVALSALVMLLDAWIDVHRSDPSTHLPLYAWEYILETGTAPAELDGHRGVARFQSAVLAYQDRIAGRLSQAKRLLRESSPEILALFAPGANEVESALIGEWDEEGKWVPGMASLTEREGQVIKELLRWVWDDALGRRRPPHPLEIAKALRPTKHRGLPPAIDSVETWVCEARRKLKLFLQVEGAVA